MSYGEEQLILTLFGYFLGIAGLVSSGFFIYGSVGFFMNQKKIYQKMVFWSIVVLIAIFAGYAMIDSPSDHFPVTTIPNSIITNN